MFFPMFLVDFFEIMRIIDIRMDTHNRLNGGDPDPLSGLRKSKTVVGAKQLRKALAAGKAKRVYLAKNADPAITEPLEALCRQNQIPCVWIPTMSDLGAACGIDVGAAAAAAVE